MSAFGYQSSSDSTAYEQHSVAVSPQPRTKDWKHRSAQIISGFRWNRMSVQASALLAENKLSQEQIAKQLGCSRRAISNWLMVPEFRARIARLVEDTRKVLAQRYIAQQDQRISSYIDDFERADRVIAERSADPTMQGVPGGSTGMIVKDWKNVAGEPLPVYQWDAALQRSRNELRKAIGEELGQLVQKHEVSELLKLDPRSLTTEQLNVMADHLLRSQLQTDDPQAIAQARREIEARVTVDAVAEVVGEETRGDARKDEDGACS